VMTFGQGSVQSILHKQKINIKGSIPAELVGADKVLTMLM